MGGYIPLFKYKHFKTIGGSNCAHNSEIPIILKMKSGCYTVTCVIWRTFCHCLEPLTNSSHWTRANFLCSLEKKFPLKHILAIQHTAPFGFHLSFRTTCLWSLCFVLEFSSRPTRTLRWDATLLWTQMNFKGPYINSNMAMWTYPGHTCTWKWWHHPTLRQFQLKS